MTEIPRILVVNRAFISKPGSTRFLLIQRWSGDSHEPNMWEIPGGKMEVGQSVEDSLRTEVRQETNFEIRVTRPPVLIEDRVLSSGKYAGLPFIGFVALAEVISGLLRLSGEHQAHRWVYPDEATRFDLSPQTAKALDRFKIDRLI